MFYFRNGKKGFTIIELIVVIAVIAIFILFGLPRLLGYVEKTQLTRIMHDVKVMEVIMENEIATNAYKNYEEFMNNGKDLGLLIEANKLFEKTGYADNLEYVPAKGEIDGLKEYKYVKLNKKQEELGIGGSEFLEEEEFKEIYERYKIIPQEYKNKAGTKLKGTFYSNPQGKVYYEPNKSIGLKGEKKPLMCSTEPLPDYTFEHEIGKIVKYHGNAEHLVIPNYFLVDGQCWPVRIIGKAAFMQGDYKSILIPDTVIIIEEDAFKDLGLSSTYIPGSVTTIRPGAFDGNL